VGCRNRRRIGGREFTRYGAEVQRLERNLRGLDGTAQKAGASLGKSLAAGLATAGVGRGLQNITAQFGRFDSELRKAAAIEGGAGSFGILKKEIEAVASVAAGTPTEVAALATAMSRAGFSADQTAQSLRGIVLGAEATDIAFADMGGIVGTILKTFQMNASQTGAVVDSLVKSANSADQTVRDVGEAMSYAAGQASALGVSVDDTLGLIALLADAGVKGSRAGTTLATGFNRIQIAAGGGDSEMQDLIRGSAKMIAAMDQLGASVLDAEGKLKPMNEVLINIKRQMQGLSTTDQAIFVKALFGQEAGRGFLAVLQRSEEDISKMISQVNNAGGTAEKTREKMRGFDDSVKILGGNIESLTNQIGGVIGAGLKPLIDFLNTAIGAAQKLPEPVKAIGAAAAAAGISVLGLVAAVAAIKATLAVVGGLSVVMGALSASFATVAGAATAAWAAITGPVGLAVLAIAGVTAAAYAMSPPFKEFVDEIPGRFEIFWQDLQRQGVESFNQISAGLIALRNLFDSAITAITNMVPEPVRQIVGTVQGMYGALANVADQIRQAFFNAFAGVENRFRDMVFSIIDNSNPLFAMLRALNVSVSEAAFKAGTVPIRSGGTGGRGVSPKAFGSSGATAPVPVLPPATGGAAGGGAAATRGAAAGGGGGGGARQQSAEDRIAAMPFGREIIAAAKSNSIDPALFAALVAQESGFNPTARRRRRHGSFSGAIGLAQLMPGTARDLGVNPRDPMQNLMGGAKYLRQQMDRFGLEGGLRAYNQGPGAQQRTPGGNSQESREYPGKVLAQYQRFAGSGEGLAGLRAEGVQSQAEAVKAMQDRLQAAKDLLVTEQDRLNILAAEGALEKLIAESRIKQRNTEEEYNNKINEPGVGVEERQTLQLALQKSLQGDSIDLERGIAALREDAIKPMTDITKEYGDRLAYEREYGGLLATGINPELAKQFMEIDRIAQASKISLEMQIATLEMMTAQLPVDSALRKSLEDQVKLKRELLGLVPEGAAEAKDDATETARVVTDREKQQADAEAKAARLKDLYGSIGSTLEEGLIGALQTGIDGLIDGTQRLDESLKEILSGVLRDIANQLLRFAVNTALKSTGLPIFADGGVFGGGSITPFANGGVVNEPTMFKFSQGGAMQNGLLGEAGPEAILPLRRGPDGRLGVEASGMAVPFQATPAAAPNDLAVPFMRSGNSSPAAMAAEAARAMASTPLEPIRLQVESQRDQSRRICHRRPAARGHEAAALAGRDSAYDGMRNNPSIQRSLGMR
jgi:TP901 family phage tail tape measure protein